MDESRINNKLPLAREGLPFVLVACSFTLLFSYLGLVIITIPAGILTLFVIFFFRDPARNNEADPKTIFTPADGTILDIHHFTDNNNLLGRPAVKISIFMSVFNVHVNRIPVGGVIQEITYRSGKFFSANLDKASEQNENNKITLTTPDSRKIVIVQIAGLIARRISCWIEKGARVETGQRFGLIRFGSRLEVYLPGDSRITARLRQKVKAGETIIGYLS